jgi:hypothetical protein
VYGEHHLRIDGKAFKANGKIHHKILGTSFSFSQGAESNNEQLLIIKDKKMSKIVDGMIKHLVKGSRGSVAAEALRRNALKIPEKEDVSAIEDKEVK